MLSVRKRGFLLWAGVIFGIGILHASYVPNGFTWLDHGDIEQGRSVVSPNRIPDAFRQRFGQTGFYRPLVTAANSLDNVLYGNWAPGWHITNVLLHVGVSVMAAKLLRAIFSLSRNETLLSAVIVGVHPISFLPVGIISYRQELLFALFSMMAVYFHIRTRLGESSVSAVGTIVCMFAAFISKETAIFLVPAWIGIWEIGYRKSKVKSQKSKVNSRQFVTTFFIEVFAIIVYLVLRIQAVPEVWRIMPAAGMSLSEMIGTRLVVLGKLIVQLLMPLTPGLSDTTSIVPLTDPGAWIAAVLLFVPVVVVVRLGIRSQLGLALIFLGISLVPALNIVPLPRFSSPHYGYIALPGIAVLIVYLLRYAGGKATRLDRIREVRDISLIGWSAAVWIIVASVSTIQAGFHFRNDLTLFEREVSRDDRFAEGHFYLGDYYFNTNNLEKASKHYEAALRKVPGIIAFVDSRAAMNNLAGVRVAQGNLDEADRLLVELFEKEGRKYDPTILYNRAVIADRNGDYESVITLLNGKDVIRQKKEAQLLLVKALQKLGREVEAAAVIQGAVKQ